ncbi:MAG TPA: tetratricopeptide repeat protein [Gemmatimonadales bacterium]|nr:tetratricopeptide repeat protein [Gemmatimonadales bacterium]
MTVKQSVGVLAALVLGAAPAQAQIANRWVEQKCGLKPGHYLVNSGVLYLKKGVETRFDEERQKQLADAERVLLQALTSGGQQENPAAWYYLGRYYALRQDAVGADSAFARAARMKPECADDIDFWRQNLWVPVFNAGVAAYQEGNLDSAIASFTRATAINPKDASGPFYLGVFHANQDRADSAIKYFRVAIERAGSDTAFADEKRQAVFNLARMHHRMQQWDQAEQAYRDYLAQYPGDAEATAALAAVFNAAGKRDSATALYRAVLDRADSVTFLDLFQAGVAIFRGAPSMPDTAAVAQRCRGAVQGTPAAVRRACRDSVARVMDEYRRASDETYRMAGRAFAEVLKKNPYYRDALYNLANTYYQLRDTANLLPVAQRLVQVDPMNRNSNLLLAQAYQFRGRGDSALYYLQVSDSILPVEVNITELSLEETSAAVGGLITNFHERPSAPLTVVFDFLNAAGDVVGTQEYGVPAIQPQGNHPFRVQVRVAGVSAYRYRPKS